MFRRCNAVVGPGCRAGDRPAALLDAMTTNAPTYRDSRVIAQTVAEREQQLEELRASMRAREGMNPDTPEFREALAREEAMLEKIHEWAIGSK